MWVLEANAGALQLKVRLLVVVLVARLIGTLWQRQESILPQRVEGPRFMAEM
jgi:hypothetical protein